MTRVPVGGWVCAQVEGATGDYRTRFDKKARAAADALISEAADFVFLHIKAVDDCGHDRQPVLKVRLFGQVAFEHNPDEKRWLPNRLP